MFINFKKKSLLQNALATVEWERNSEMSVFIFKKGMLI